MDAIATRGRRTRIRLSWRPPYPWAWLAEFVARRAIPGVEVASPAGYRRIVVVDGAAGSLAVAPGDGGLVATLALSDRRPAGAVAARLRRQFDLDADAAAIDGHLARDPLLAPLVAARPGLRVPRAWDPFELAVRAIVGQQVSVAAATTLTGRLVARFGHRVGEGEPGYAFPAPERLADADVAAIGVPRRRGEAIAGFARAVAEGQLALDPSRPLDATVEALCALPGIGPWTAHYIAMRGLGHGDAFPAGDLGLVRAAGAAGGRALAARAEAWRPWRAYAAMHLWAAAGAGG